MSRALHALPAGLLLVLALPAGAAMKLQPELLSGMKARAIGPAGMSGRVAAIEGIAADPEVLYVGAATGGVFRSENGGVTFESVWDDQPVAAIGAVAVFQSNPDIVWVGTGEGNPRNSASVGNGVYRSLDGGRTWRHVGLDGTERIHRIVLHPEDPDIAYVAALGRAWGENEERGVFRTLDGGRTWEKVLYIDARTGAADLAMDPRNPLHLIAAMWDYRRWPWFFRSGGPGSGLFATYDGGETWVEITPRDGLPRGDLGRIGIAFAASNPDIVYAFVEAAERNVFLRSEDGGRTWQDTGAKKRFGNRPFYYADIRVDPKDPNRVYSLWSALSASDDGGRTWRVIADFSAVHPDHHALWIDPGDPRHLVAGNDGGVYVSRDRGATWRFVSNLPLAQFYHIRVDMDLPYHIYGGMQDNGSWRGPSSVWENGGIRNHHWEEVGFGDGFDTIPDPEDSLTGYAMSQEGYLFRWNLRTGERRMIRPAGPPGVELRFNWNAALAIDPFDPATIYFGSQFVHRSRDRGMSWEIISPDLTTDNPEWQHQDESGGLTRDVTGAENYTTIVAIAPSPVQRGLIWAGTDDGRLHVTSDGGESWTSVERNLDGVPENTWVAHIEPSHHDAETAYVVFDDHRRSNWETYVLRTRDLGRHWKRLPVEGVSGYALAIAEDPVDPDLLFLGTEFGLFVTVDGGDHWFRWKHGFPTVPVRDLVVHPRDGDLVVGTHGRGAYVIDDLTPLREISPEILEKRIHLFRPPPAQQYVVKQTGASRFPGNGEFRGENRPYGALISFWLGDPELPHPDEKRRRDEERRRRMERRLAGAAPSREAESPTGTGEPGTEEEKETPKATIRVYDSEGALIRAFRREVVRGLNRVVWDLRRDPFREPPREPSPWREARGPEVPPGRYEVKVAYGDAEASTEVDVLPDPRLGVTAAERRENWEAQMEAGRLQERAVAAIESLLGVREDVETVLGKARRKWDVERRRARGETLPAAYRELEEAARKLRRRLDEVERLLWQPPDLKGIHAEKDALSRIETAQWMLSSTWSRPTPAALGYLERARRTLEESLAAHRRLMEGEVAAFRALAQEHGLLTLLPAGGTAPGGVDADR